MLGLIGAATIGLFVGLSLEDDTKDRIVDDIKKTLYKAQTGRDYKPYKPVTTYASYYNKCDAKPEEEKESWTKALKFDTYREAVAFLSKLKDRVSKYGALSVFDLCKLREMSDLTSGIYSVSWEMDKYGWTEKMIATEATILSAIGGTIVLPKPVVLK